MDRDRLLENIENYLRDSGMSPSRFGKLAMSDPLFVRDLRQGRDCRKTTSQRVYAWMRANPVQNVA